DGNAALLKHWQPQANQGTFSRRTIHGHAGGFTIENFETFGHVGHADACSSKSGGLFQQLRGAHADSVIFHFNGEPRISNTAAQMNAAAFQFGRESVLDVISDQGLEQQAGHHNIDRFLIEILDHLQLVAAKANDFNVEIVVNELNFVAKRYEGVGAVEKAAQDGG